ncbi:carbonic anhydrase [Halomonas sp. V046]|uniref:carbonic anhydrase n=1 Tax=Halomonas sp. V046 TaxID=3459611 RepID=UPI0040445774
MNYRALIGALGVAMTSATLAASDPMAWSYSGPNGPHRWAEVSDEYELCASGHQQSPVHLHRGVDASLPLLDVEYPAPATQVVHDGHTVKLQSPAGNTLRLDGESYALKQVHFHAPAEHRLRGRHFPLEAHLVHADGAGNLAVVAVLYEIGATDAALASLMGELPHAGSARQALAPGLDPAALLPDERDYFRLDGSLTTPPCSEGVSWVVLRTAKTLDEDQLDAVEQAIGFDNNRPRQPLNGRVVRY